MVCLPTGAVVGASCVLFYQSGRRSRHPRVPSTGKASILSCEFLLFSRTNSRALGNFCTGPTRGLHRRLKLKMQTRLGSLTWIVARFDLDPRWFKRLVGSRFSCERRCALARVLH